VGISISIIMIVLVGVEGGGERLGTWVWLLAEWDKAILHRTRLGVVPITKHTMQ